MYMYSHNVCYLLHYLVSASLYNLFYYNHMHNNTIFIFNSAPNTNYEYTVAGVTDAGTGPSTAPAPFTTREGGM